MADIANMGHSQPLFHYFCLFSINIKMFYQNCNCSANCSTPTVHCKHYFNFYLGSVSIMEDALHILDFRGTW